MNDENIVAEGTLSFKPETGKAKSRDFNSTVTLMGDNSFTITNDVKGNHGVANYLVTVKNQYTPIYVNGNRFTYLHLLLSQTVPNPENKKYIVNPSITSLDHSKCYWTNNRPNHIVEVKSMKFANKVFASINDVSEHIGKSPIFIHLALKKRNGRIPSLMTELISHGKSNITTSKDMTDSDCFYEIVDLVNDKIITADTLTELSEKTGITVQRLSYQL